MDKNSNRNDLFTRLFALVIFITICLLYNNYRASVEYQKELQKKKDKEMSEFLRMYELESIKSNNEDIIPEETEYKGGYHHRRKARGSAEQNRGAGPECG